MSLDPAQLQAQLDRMEIKQDTILKMLNTARRPHLTVRQFAAAIGRSESHVYDLISIGRITKERGRIPATYVDRYTSQPAT
jgi:hypothetical protein